jgi:pimeloyl-ACP methyl ester carboxylesterase
MNVPIDRMWVKRVTLRFFLVSHFLLLASPLIGAPSDPNMERKIVRAADRLNLVCEDRGKSDTTLVFLHGWSGDHDYWKNQVKEFAADYRVVAVDQAGHGESGKTRQNWTVNSLGQDVESVAKALGLKRMILIGHSMSGPVALVAAHRMPGKVVGIIAVDTLQNAEFTRPEDVSKKFLDDFAKDYEGTLSVTFPGLLHEKTDPDLGKWLLNKAQAFDRTVALGLLRDLTGLDTVPLFKQANVPIRAINSSGGYQFFMPTAVDINKKYADFDVVFMDGVGHYPMLEKPKEFNQKLRELLKTFKK